MRANIFQQYFGDKIKIKKDFHITDHSKKLTTNSIFFARQGVYSHGNDFINDNLIQKAKFIFSSKRAKFKSDNFIYVPNLESKLLNFLFAYWDIPKTTKFYGITGTNGKTTTAFILYQLLKKLNKNVVYIGTIGAHINSKWYKVSNTTPGLFDLFQLIGRQKDKDELCVVLEVSSHALDQERLGKLRFESSLITNIASDHLDYHKSQENYENAKLKIISKTKGPVLCAGNSYKILENKSAFLNSTKPIKIECHRNNKDPKAISYKLNKSLLKFNLDSATRLSFASPFQDSLNNLNFVSALSMLSAIDKRYLNNLSTSNLKLPKGRFELIPLKQNKTIIVDFAHDHNSMKALLKETSKDFKHKVVVFGCGGNRDRAKRPKMMKIAIKYADEIIFTSDNSRNETFQSIAEDALSGRKESKVKLIENRGDAIIEGISRMQTNGVLYVLGRGHETILEIGNKKTFFNDANFIRKSI